MARSVQVTMEDDIARVVLNRPEVFNAIDQEMVTRFTEHLVNLATDRNVRGVVVTGAGKAFSAGGDVKSMFGGDRDLAAALHLLAGRLHEGILEIRRMRKPVIAAVNGVAAGAGFSIALACDFRVIGQSASLRQAYTSIGLCPDGGGSFTLPRLVGFARAMEIVAFDEPISAEQALDWGLATKVVNDANVVVEAMGMARALAERSLHAFAVAKQLLTDAFDTSFETHIERERSALRSCGAHPEGQEGVRAFAEKRKPVFRRA